MRLTKLFTEFFESEKAGGLVLVACTIVSLLLANSSLQDEYIHLWHLQIANNSLAHWIDNGLMAIFFLLVGLELEREIYQGELSSLKNATLPIFGALGGMLMPAGIFLLLNYGTSTQAGAGIPMATDIAFAVGVLSLLGNRVPASLKVFLTALAVIDDLGAILVIAIFYTDTIQFTWLLGAAGIFAILIILNRLKIHHWLPYIAGGIALWYCMLNSGVHATISGVLLAFAIPFGDGGPNTLSYKLQRFLHIPVAFIILPLFALANTSITIGSNWTAGLLHSNSLGIAAGLVIGKPLGIFLFAFTAVKLKFGTLAEDLSWKQLAGAGMLGGIGFTMSIFITLLAFEDNEELILSSKIAILISSLLAAVAGYMWLSTSFNAKRPTQNA
ncbi:MAG: Na+/H+ antiporter NhaA [Chitinophagaceae bacterium]